MKIRQLHREDDEVLATIIRHELEHYQLNLPGTAYFDPELDHLSEFYRYPGRGYFVVVDANDQVVGGAGFGEYVPKRKIAELQKVYISQAAQGHGWSYPLIKKVEQAAREAGYEYIALESHHRLAAALHVYHKLGYHSMPASLTTSDAHNLMDCFMIKPLTETGDFPLKI